jgi:hypothetical protein
MSNDEATPRPWHYDDTAIFAQDGVLARVPNHPENGINWMNDAAFIVEAVNSYDANQVRIRELEKALEFYADSRRYDGPNQRPIENDPYADADAVYIKDVTRDHGRIAKAALTTRD